MTFSDAAGDAVGGGYDITTVTLSNDDSGTLQFRAVIRSHSGFSPGKGIGLFFDTDRNQSTGAAGGEYRVFSDPNGTPGEFNRWNFSTGRWNSVPGVLLSSSFSNGVWSGSLRSSGLGVTVFDFEVNSYNQQPDGSRPTADSAPNSGAWPYEVKIGSPASGKKLAIDSFTQSPPRPIAGERFRVSFGVLRIGYPGRWNGSLYCNAKVGGRTLRQFGSPQRGRAACQWDIPKSAAGQLLTGLVVVSEGDATPARRSFRARVARAAVRLVLPPNPVTTVPDQPEAGFEFKYALNIVVRRGSVDKAIQRGSVECSAVIGGRTYKAKSARIRGGVDGDALCTWGIPFGSNGQLMTGKVVVVSEGRKLTHRFKRRIL